MSIAVSPKSIPLPLTLPRFMPVSGAGAGDECGSEAATIKAEREDGLVTDGIAVVGGNREEPDEALDAEILARLSIGGAAESLLVASQ